MLNKKNQKNDHQKYPERLTKPRIPPLSESEWNEEQKELLTAVRKQMGVIYNLVSTTARHPEWCKASFETAFYVATKSTIPPKDREILILRTAWLCGTEYVFGHHTLVARAAGLSDDEIFRLTQVPDIDAWSIFEAALIRAADELKKDAFIQDNTWKIISEQYNEKQLMDVIITVGYYNLVSMILNSLGVPLDPGVPGFPIKAKRQE
jgi:4-carboxymuconolactone decarboxylase